MARLAALVGTALLAVTLAGHASAATYYVSPLGDDTNTGTSPAEAWRTLAHVNGTKLEPGDAVLLEGGQTLAGPLVPWGSGKPGAPIVFSSYGTGRATISSRTNNIVFLHAASWLTIRNLRLTADGADMHVIVSDPATTSAHVTIRNNLITGTAAFGINSPSLTDHDWTIRGNVVSRTGQTGITFHGSDFRVIGNLVEDTGLHPSEAAHGIYAKGPRAQVVGNVVRNFGSSGVSIRYADSVVRGNAIDGGLIGVSYFQDRSVTEGGTSTIAYNRISDVTEAGIFLDDSSLESLVIASNTIRTASGSGLNLHRVVALTLVNNLVTGRFDPFAALVRKPARAYVEDHNLWYPSTGPRFGWNGAVYPFAAYQKGSGQGAHDLLADPKLDRSLRPARSSPALEAGAAVPGLGYRRACDGKAFSYCGRAPDIGALERRGASAG